MNRDVFLSLLALDSYNRGYDRGLNELSESGGIGNATIRAFQPQEQDGWEEAGFYAIAYEWNGETIISYRGTSFPDFNNLTAESVEGFRCPRHPSESWRLGLQSPALAA